MILAFSEDGTVQLFDSEDAAIREFEGVDVESQVVHFYRDDGTYLQPVFTVPNRYGRWFGIIPWSESGIYRLTPNPFSTEDPLWLALLEHPNVEPALGIADAPALRAYLAARGAIVEQPRESEQP